MEKLEDLEEVVDLEVGGVEQVVDIEEFEW